MQEDPRFVLKQLEFLLVYLLKSEVIIRIAKAVYRHIFPHIHKLIQKGMYATLQRGSNSSICNR